MEHRPSTIRRTSAPERERPTLRPDIEGLRAVAVLLVLLYHLGVPGLSSGFAGVDVFFVISGFLITAHLLRELEGSGRIRLGRFYARRARRLLPVATLVLVFTAVAGYLLLPAVDHRNLATDVFGAAIYVLNWGLALRSVDYLAEDAAVSPVQHYWSLSVEEQFYLVVPVLLIVVGWWALRRGADVRTAVGWTLLTIVVVSLGWSVWHTAGSPQTAYFVSTTRVWELAVGSLLAVCLPRVQELGRRPAEVLALVGAAMLVWSAVTITSATPWPGSAALLPVLGTAAVIAAGCRTQGTVVARLLGLSPLVWVGGLSYAIYLWHWPLVVYADTLGRSGLWTGSVILALTVGLSWASRRYVEDPIRFGSLLSGASWRPLVMGSAAMAMSLLTAGAVWATVPTLEDPPAEAAGARALQSSAPGADPTPPPADPTGQGESADPDPLKGGSAGQQPSPRPEPTEDAQQPSSRPEAPDDGQQPSARPQPQPQPEPEPEPEPTFATSGEVYPEPELAVQDVPEYYSDGCQATEAQTELLLDCVYGVPESDTVVAVVGDSKAGQWLTPLTEVAEQEGWRLETYLKSGCGLNPAQSGDYPECGEFGQHVVEHLTAEPGRVDLVIGSMVKSSDDPAEGAYAEDYVQGHLQTWAALEDSDAQVVMIADTPNPDKDDLAGAGSVYECVSQHRDDWSVCSFAAAPGSGTPAMRAAAEQSSSVEVLDLNPWICPASQCPPVIGGILVYRQGSHITDAYAASLQKQLHQELSELGVATGPAGPAGEQV